MKYTLEVKAAVKNNIQNKGKHADYEIKNKAWHQDVSIKMCAFSKSEDGQFLNTYCRNEKYTTCKTHFYE